MNHFLVPVSTVIMISISLMSDSDTASNVRRREGNGYRCNHWELYGA
jgi:hypothetical protein